jgi:hypothetical protein
MPSAHRRAATIESSSGTDPEFLLDSDSDDSDAELIQVRAALAPAPPDATSQELRKVSHCIARKFTFLTTDYYY